MKMFKLWMVVMLLGLLPVVSEAQEEINNAINVQLEYLKKYPKDKEALRKVSFLYLNKADYDQAIFYGRQLFFCLQSSLISVRNDSQWNLQPW